MNDLPAVHRFLALTCVIVLLGCVGGVDEGERIPAEEPEDVVHEVEGDTGAVPDSAAISRTVYVADYSHIYHGSERSRHALTTTLSIRNTDPLRPITVTSVRYYNTAGELTRRFLGEPRRLEPLGTVDFVVAEHDTSGGSGANFIVEWRADRPVSEPLIESVMISTRLGQGLSFTSRGVPVVRTPE